MIVHYRFNLSVVYVTIPLSLDILNEIRHRIVILIILNHYSLICEMTEKWYWVSCAWPCFLFSHSRSSGLNGYLPYCCMNTVVWGIKSLSRLSRHSCGPSPSQSCPLLPPVTEGVGNKSNSAVYRIVIAKTPWSKDTWQDTKLNMSWLYLWHIFRPGRPMSCSTWHLRSDSGNLFQWLVEREPWRVIFLTGCFLEGLLTRDPSSVIQLDLQFYFAQWT